MRGCLGSSRINDGASWCRWGSSWGRRRIVGGGIDDVAWLSTVGILIQGGDGTYGECQPRAAMAAMIKENGGLLFLLRFSRRDDNLLASFFF